MSFPSTSCVRNAASEKSVVEWNTLLIPCGVSPFCYVPPYSGFFVPSYFGVRQAESPTLSPGGLAPATGWDKGPIGIGER